MPRFLTKYGFTHMCERQQSMRKQPLYKKADKFVSFSFVNIYYHYGDNNPNIS
jgi:hypothetical protein